jgi:AcrR family transcriptional regulator
MLQEAATELFVENTYAGTTIEQITQRAGVSRNTFFNYFQSKSDLLWIELDTSIRMLADELAATDPDAAPLDAVAHALAATAAGFTADRAPLVLTQHEVMGIDGDLAAAGLARALGLADVIERFLVPRVATASDAGAVARAVVGAASAAVGAWASAGPGRGALGEYVDRAVGPVLAGYRAAFARDHR